MLKIAPQLLCLLILVACVATAALAQEGAAPGASEAPAEATPFVPGLEQRVPLRGRYMPREAMERSITGVAVACCIPNEDRSLNCEIGWETPAGIGFGDAALRILATQQLTEESHADYTTRLGPRPFAQLMTFRISGERRPPASPSAAERQALCDAAMSVED